MLTKPSPTPMIISVSVVVVLALLVILTGCLTTDTQRERNIETRAQLQTLSAGVDDLAAEVGAGLAATDQAISETSAAIAAVAQVIAEERQAVTDDPTLDPAAAAAANARLEGIEQSLEGLVGTIESTTEARAAILAEVESTAEQIKAVAARLPDVIDETGAVDLEAAAEVAKVGVGFAPEPYRSIGYVGISLATALGGLIFGNKRGKTTERNNTTQPVFHALGDVVRGVASVLDILPPDLRAKAEESLRSRQVNGQTHKLVKAIQGRGVSGIVTDLESR